MTVVLAPDAVTLVQVDETVVFEEAVVEELAVESFPADTIVDGATVVLLALVADTLVSLSTSALLSPVRLLHKLL